MYLYDTLHNLSTHHARFAFLCPHVVCPVALALSRAWRADSERVQSGPTQSTRRPCHRPSFSIHYCSPPMPASSSTSSSGKYPMGTAPDNLRTEPAPSSSQPSTASTSRLDAVSRSLFAPFNHRKRDSRRILADRTSFFFSSLPLILCPYSRFHDSHHPKNTH
jgi:hypothetical protein